MEYAIIDIHLIREQIFIFNRNVIWWKSGAIYKSEETFSEKYNEKVFQLNVEKKHAFENK